MKRRSRVISLPWAVIVLAVTGLSAPPLAAAQATPSTASAAPQTQTSFLTTPAFARRVEGKSIVVITTDGQNYEGHFAISGNALVMRDARTPTTVPFDEVARVQKSTFRIRKHSLIGLGVGVGVGALLTAAACAEGCNGEPWFLVFGPIGGGIGAGVGAGNGAVRNARNAEADIIYDSGLRATATLISAQTSRLGTSAFAQEVEGKDVWITTADGARRRGNIAVVTADDVILTGRQHASLPSDQIVSIVEVSHRIRNGMLNGLGAGASVGILSYLARPCYECSGYGADFFGYSALGVGVGAAIGALMNRDKDRDVLHDAGRRTTTLALAPILSPSRKGVAFTMTWR